jgi:hypothetical protein
MSEDEAQIVVGIDPGASGGMAAVSKHSGALIARAPLPIVNRRGKAEPDLPIIVFWLRALHSPADVWLEEPLKHARSSQAMRSMGIGFGMIYGALSLESGVRSLHTAQVSDWQKVMLGNVIAGSTKQAALIKANELAEDDWLATPRSKVPHDGIVDAFLIARFGQAGGIPPTPKRVKRGA